MSETPIQINLALQHTITSKIKQNGAISFAQFMKMALYEPGLGYYSAGLNKIGVDGDFITASELGSLFARCHAKVFADVLAELNKPIIVELGAGTGQFCIDVLLTMDELKVLPDTYYIVEVSADFKQVQANKIKLLPSHLQSKVQWLNQPPTSYYEGIVFANEVLDALPVEVFKFEDHQYHRLMLEYNNTNNEQVWHEVWQNFPPVIEQQLHQMDLNLSDGYRSEFLPHLSAWMASVTQNLNKGLVLLVDYGYGRSTYYHPQRNTGTLVCQQRHQANFNPYQDIGLQDITAFVDFTAVAEALTASGFELAGYTTQGDFLLASGIDHWIDPNADFQQYYRLISEMKQLMLPDEMGEKFKCMAAVKNISSEIIGFSHNRWNEL
jgi:SAM-dependent MidA family methyltransferase